MSESFYAPRCDWRQMLSFLEQLARIAGAEAETNPVCIIGLIPEVSPSPLSKY